VIKLRKALAFFCFLLTAVPVYSEDSTLAFKETDAAMNAAIADARQTLPDFLKMAAAGDLASEIYSVKRAVPLGNSDGGVEVEHIWITLDAIAGDTLTGRYSNQPDYFKARLGDRVTFPVSEVSDWSYWDADGMLHGSYTTRVMLSVLSQDEAAALSAQLAPLPE
jgi:uncharacterized protein YegJ (DUF2314 family)